MSESPESKKEGKIQNSDLVDLVQWGNKPSLETEMNPKSTVNTDLPPLPPPPKVENNIPSPPPINNLELEIPPPPNNNSAVEIPPPPPMTNENVEQPTIEIPPPPLDNTNLLTSLPPLPPPKKENSPFAIPEQLSEKIEEVIDVTEVEENDYRQLWKRTSDKPLQQVYGHIDRIGTGEVGSLLDRYADRFGSDLDREIIVLRQQERQQKMQELNQVPIVELIEEHEVVTDNEEMIKDETVTETKTESLSEDDANKLEDELDSIEDDISKLEKLYKKAKKKKKEKDINKYSLELNSLFERRDSINSLLDGEEEFEVSSETEVAITVEENLFKKFVLIVDDLLGKLPEKELNSFVNSGEFKIYENIASNPKSADETEKSTFFKLVNDKLAQLPEEVINEFIASSDWPLYEEIGELYSR